MARHVSFLVASPCGSTPPRCANACWGRESESRCHIATRWSHHVSDDESDECDDDEDGASGAGSGGLDVSDGEGDSDSDSDSDSASDSDSDDSAFQ